MRDKIFRDNERVGKTTLLLGFLAVDSPVGETQNVFGTRPSIATLDDAPPRNLAKAPGEAPNGRRLVLRISTSLKTKIAVAMMVAIEKRAHSIVTLNLRQGGRQLSRYREETDILRCHVQDLELSRETRKSDRQPPYHADEDGKVRYLG